VRYDWPGNVRELINVIERAVLLAPADSIRLADLPRSIGGARPREPAAGAGAAADAVVPRADLPLEEARRAALAEFTRSYLSAQLRATGGRVGETARRAGISERSLYELMKRYGLRKEDFRAVPRRARPAH
jgi:DNA-binding NtrC family response regulator